MSTLAVQQLVATNGYYPSYEGAPAFSVGMIQSYAGAGPAFNAPQAKGQLLSINQYPVLYSIYGSSYGGDGRQNFALPDLDKRSIVGGAPGQSGAESLAMTYMIATESGGMAPAAGAVAAFGGGRAPAGWLACDGSLLQISAYTELFSVIGTLYGGDGVSSFALPNLSGAAAVGAGKGVALGQKVPGTLPGLGLNYAICAEGLYPMPSGDGSFPDNEAYLGQVLAYAGVELPAGWMACNGTMMPEAQFQALFSLLGYTYGGGGSAFALPDLRGRMIVGGTPGMIGDAKTEMPMPAA
ncbi:tail fiber protein [Sphingomonas sp. DT-207]|uniref:tail fiber protein n=1 Tax=Sphingomonas sp. DT-207 TaxID=3396167 RepID=UPI003F1DC00C